MIEYVHAAGFLVFSLFVCFMLRELLPCPLGVLKVGVGQNAFDIAGPRCRAAIQVQEEQIEMHLRKLEEAAGGPETAIIVKSIFGAS